MMVLYTFFFNLLQIQSRFWKLLFDKTWGSMVDYLGLDYSFNALMNPNYGMIYSMKSEAARLTLYIIENILLEFPIVTGLVLCCLTGVAIYLWIKARREKKARQPSRTALVLPRIRVLPMRYVIRKSRQQVRREVRRKARHLQELENKAIRAMDAIDTDKIAMCRGVIDNVDTRRKRVDSQTGNLVDVGVTEKASGAHGSFRLRENEPSTSSLISIIGVRGSDPDFDDLDDTSADPNQPWIPEGIDVDNTSDAVLPQEESQTQSAQHDEDVVHTDDEGITNSGPTLKRKRDETSLLDESNPLSLCEPLDPSKLGDDI